MDGVGGRGRQTGDFPLVDPTGPLPPPPMEALRRFLQFVDLTDFDYPFPAPWTIRPHLGRTPAAEIHMGAGVQD